MRPYSHAVTQEESQGAPRNLKEGLTSLRQQERFPEVPVTTREEHKTSHCNSRNTTRFPPQCETRPNSPAVTGEQSCALLHNLKGDLTSLRQYKRFPEVPITIQEGPQASCCNSRKNTRFPTQCDMRSFCCSASRAIPSSLSKFSRRLDSLYSSQEVP